MSADASPNHQSKLAAAGANLAVDATAAEVIGAFRDAGIRSVLLKGPSIGRWLYPADSARVSVDVDLLVAPAGRGRAEEALTRLGFTAFPTNPAGVEVKHAHCWRRDRNPITVDLHLTLPGVGVSDDDVWSLLSAETEQLVVGDLTVEMLSEAARAMHVALHAGQHGPGFSGPVSDLERAVEQLPIAVWKEASALAVQLGAESLFAAGLGLHERGTEILQHVGLSGRKTVEVALRSTTGPDLALGFHRLAGTRGLSAKLAFVARKIVPPPAWMRAVVPLARRGRLGLVAAYLLRPLWLLRRAGPAFRAWRRAVREAR
jgi:putative nucleotidyltransferase-like protein